MTHYRNLPLKLDLPNFVSEAQDGKFKLPQYTFDCPFDPIFGFPPILVPIWSNSALPGYIAAVTNWFGGVDGGFVKYYSSEQSASEIALNVDQLKTWLVLDFLINVPGRGGRVRGVDRAMQRFSIKYFFFRDQ